MKKMLRGVVWVGVMAWLVGGAFAGEPPRKPAAPVSGAPAAGDAAKPTLVLKGNVIMFDRSTGDVRLDGQVHVVRTEGEDVLTVDCDHMTAKMKDEKMESVLATGNVKLKTKAYDATAVKATFDFNKNITVLYGEDGKPATVKAQGMVSMGPEIIFHMDSQRVEMLKGGETMIDLKSSEPAKPEAGSP